MDVSIKAVLVRIRYWVHRISDLAHINNAELCRDACAFTVYMLASECSNVIFHPGDGEPLILYSYITCAGGGGFG